MTTTDTGARGAPLGPTLSDDFTRCTLESGDVIEYRATAEVRPWRRASRTFSGESRDIAGVVPPGTVTLNDIALLQAMELHWNPEPGQQRAWIYKCRAYWYDATAKEAA